MKKSIKNLKKGIRKPAVGFSSLGGFLIPALLSVPPGGGDNSWSVYYSQTHQPEDHEWKQYPIGGYHPTDHEHDTSDSAKGDRDQHRRKNVFDFGHFLFLCWRLRVAIALKK